MAFETNKDIEHRFSYHRPDGDKIIQHSDVREGSLQLALLFNENLPNGREKALALTKIEEAMFWANAAVARSAGKPSLPPVGN